MTGHGRVAPLTVEIVAAEHEGTVDSRALRRMGGQRVAVLEPAGVEVGGIDLALVARPSPQPHRTALGVQADDLGAGAVDHLLAAVVAPGSTLATP